MNIKNKLIEWLRNNKALSVSFAVIIVLVLVLLVFAAQYILPSRPVNDIRLSSPGSMGVDSPGRAVTEEGTTSLSEQGAGEEVEINEARIEIKSEDAEAESEDVRSATERYEGYIERSGKTETNTLLRVTMTARVPQENFDQFVEELKEQFEVENYDMHNFRASVQRQLDELDVLNNALEDYALVRQEIMEMPAGQERIDLLMEVTDKEEELTSRIRTYERSLGEEERRGEMSTVNIALEERLRADLWPEEIGNRFRDSMQNALDSVADSIIAITTVSIALFFSVIEWLVYAIIVLVPVGLVYKGGRHVHRQYKRRGNTEKNETTRNKEV